MRASAGNSCPQVFGLKPPQPFSRVGGDPGTPGQNADGLGCGASPTPAAPFGDVSRPPGSQSKHSRRTVPTSRSQYAFALGACTGLACFRMGMSGSASFQRVERSLCRQRAHGRGQHRHRQPYRPSFLRGQTPHCRTVLLPLPWQSCNVACLR
jgi:hypothetical protein